jgi:hypothetical protein
MLSPREAPGIVDVFVQTVSDRTAPLRGRRRMSTEKFNPASPVKSRYVILVYSIKNILVYQ